MSFKIFLAGLAILLITGGVIFLSRSNSSTITKQITTVTTAPPVLTNTPTPTGSSAPLPVTAKTNTNILQANGQIRGQIICDYVTPAAPNSYGQAKIKSNWNNTKISVCVNVNGNNTLMANDATLDGSRTDSANWISLNSGYQFNLYSGLNCSGLLLSSCNINQPSSTLPPTPSGGFSRH